MFIDEPRWEALTRHVGVPRHLPPKLTYSTLSALVPAEKVVAGHAFYDISNDQQTVWSHWVLTDRHIARTEILFVAKWFDQDEENDPLTRQPETKVTQAWTRRRSDITQIAFADVRPFTNSKAPLWFDTGDVTITFADGTTEMVRCPVSVSNPDERQQLDMFLTTLRDF